MKINLIQVIMAGVFAINAFAIPVEAQDALQEKVSISLEKGTIKTFLKSIEKQTNVLFSYKNELIANDLPLTVEIKNEKVEDVLRKVLTPRNISFETVGKRQIILVRSMSNRNEVKENSLNQTEKTTLNINNSNVADITIKGTIIDEKGEKLPGVSISVKGTTRGTTTNSNGEYSISVLDNKATLVFSFVGFLNQEIVVGNRTQINVVLLQDSKSLEEVVVVGYGTVKKSDITGSVSSIKAQEINAFPVQNATQSLNGRATGVHVVQNSGAPGGALSVKIRGGNSLQGSNEPLYVVDGFPLTGNINALNPADIESMEILKDASATAIYGSRGANGVIVITTKSGRAGKTQFRFDTEVGQNTPILPPTQGYPTDVNDYFQLFKEGLANAGVSAASAACNICSANCAKSGVIASATGSAGFTFFALLTTIFFSFSSFTGSSGCTTSASSVIFAVVVFTVAGFLVLGFLVSLAALSCKAWLSSIL